MELNNKVALWRPKLVNGIIAAIVIAVVVNMCSLSYWTDTPECPLCKQIPCNPNISWYRISGYAVWWLLAQAFIFSNEKCSIVFYLVCAAGGVLIVNEALKYNQNWRFWQFVEFGIAIVFPIVEKWINTKIKTGAC